MQHALQQEGKFLTFVGNSMFDLLIPTLFIGEESLSQLFSFLISGYCEEINFSLAALLHQSVCLQIVAKNQTRFFHGSVAAIENHGIIGNKHRRFTLFLQPQIAFLNKTMQSRIFQNQTVIEIILFLLKIYGISHVDTTSLQNRYDPKPYCVQYNETTLHFILRLLEEAGIFYYFTFYKTHHTMHLIDTIDALPSHDHIMAYSNRQQDGDYIHDWTHTLQLTSTKFNSTDYCYLTPDANLHTSVISSNKINTYSNSEIYFFPGYYQNHMAGQNNTTLAKKKYNGKLPSITAASNAILFFAGLRFTLNHAEQPTQNGQYVITAIKHEAEDVSHFLNKEFMPPLTATPEKHTQRYINHFQGQLAHNNFIPDQRQYLKPKVHGFHNAIVVGAETNTIHTDILGRIQVKFPWILPDKNTEQRSCWLRVVQQQVGKDWGMHFLPRVGQEVQISFEQGDIDRPICIGALYNSLHATPYSLPLHQAVSGIKTCSIGLHTANYGHELQFNDSPTQESIIIRAQNQLIESVDHDALSVIGNNEETKVAGNKVIKIEKTATYQVQKKLQLKGQGGTICIEPDCISIIGTKIHVN